VVADPNPGHAPPVVPTAQEALDGLADALEAEHAESLGELGIVAGDELGEVNAE